MLYIKARFGDGVLGRGMGFGNRLFPWARYCVFSRFNQGTLIAPVWMRPALGQLWRGGVAYENYLRQLVLFGLFKKRDRELGVIVGNLRAMGAIGVTEPAEIAAPVSLAATGPRHIKIVFEGYEDYFRPLNGWHELLFKELRSITKAKYLELADAVGEVPVGICVRCGNDFSEADKGAKRLVPGEKTPLRWFVQSLQLIRQAAGRSVKAVVVSDGTRSQLKELLEMEDVVFLRPGCAISDLLTLAKGRILLGSGSSSFCAWASFLGQMPSISHPGQPLTDWSIEPTCGQFIGEFDPRNPSAVFLDEVRRTMAP